jgi:LPXTG-motif cell wall-anchored protein
MNKTPRFALLAVATVASVSMLAAPAWAANNDVAPTIDFTLPNLDTLEYETDSLAVESDGSYWLCAAEQMPPFGVFALKFAAHSSTGASAVQSIDLNIDGQSCGDLTVDSEGNVYAGLGNSIAVYAPDATGVATPIRTITSATFGLDAQSMNVDTQDRLYVVTNNDIWMYTAAANGTDLPYRIINGSNLGDDGLYVAADADGVVYVADYDEDKVRVFGATNDGPFWDRDFWFDTDSDARNFGGITSNGDKIYVTYQDGTAPGIYVFPSNSEGATPAFESWSGVNVVSSSDDALFDVGVGGCSGEMITIEGYNDRILTWGNLTTECTNPAPSPSPELPSTGADLGSATGLGLGAAVLALVGGALVLRRRVRFHG